MPSRGNKLTIIILMGFFGVAYAGVAIAQHGHDHGRSGAAPSQKTTPREEAGSKGKAQSVNAEGLKVTLEVMSMGEHMKHAAKGGSHGDADHAKSHSIMVTIQDKASREIISDAKVQYTLTSPSGGKETGKLEWSGDHYAGGFSPKEKGAYQVQLRIEGGGMEREATFTYEAK